MASAKWHPFVSMLPLGGGPEQRRSSRRKRYRKPALAALNDSKLCRESGWLVVSEEGGADLP